MRALSGGVGSLSDNSVQLALQSRWEYDWMGLSGSSK